jgi:signal transduction histidine kinase
MADRPKLVPDILLVEDEPLIAMYIEDALRRSGFTVSGPFETVARGLDAARRFNGAAALVDLMLDGEDATIVTEVLSGRNIPFLVMTGRDEIDALPSSVFAPVLKKPFLIGDLLGAIREICAGRTGGQEGPSSATILNVGGNEPRRASRSKALLHAGYRIQEASNSAEALALLETIEPHLVVLDMDPPDGGDTDLCRQIKHDFPATVVFQITADGDRVSCFEGDPDCQLSRQVEPADLVAVIGAVLRSRPNELFTEALRRQCRNMVAISRFNGHQAHDFNNKLHAIKTGLELIKSRTSEPKIAALAQQGQVAVDAGTSIIRQMLPFSSLHAPEMAPVDLNRLIRAMAPLLERTIGSAVTLALDLAPEIAPALTDANQLRLAILNLATNACEAMRHGGGLTLRTVAVGDNVDDGSGFPSAGFVEIQALDTGCGMPQPVLERAHEPFFTTKVPGERFGLGLAQVDAIVRDSGGTLRIESEIGHGTTVHILLPVAAA